MNQFGGMSPGVISTIAPNAEEGSIKVTRSTTPEQFIRMVLKDELEQMKKKRVTWDRGQPPPVPLDRVVGLLNKRLAYIQIGGYYIQNLLILDSAGREVALTDISDEKFRWRDKFQMEHVAPSTRESVRIAYEIHLKEAMKVDPMLCPIAGDYRAKDMEDRTAHLYWKHPVEFKEMVESHAGEPSEENPVVVDANAELAKFEAEVSKRVEERLAAAKPPVQEIECCGEMHRGRFGLQAHQRGKIHQQLHASDQTG